MNEGTMKPKDPNFTGTPSAGNIAKDLVEHHETEHPAIALTKKQTDRLASMLKAQRALMRLPSPGLMTDSEKVAKTRLNRAAELHHRELAEDLGAVTARRAIVEAHSVAAGVDTAALTQTLRGLTLQNHGHVASSIPQAVVDRQGVNPNMSLRVKGRTSR
jgi:hypothetical protein